MFTRNIVNRIFRPEENAASLASTNRKTIVVLGSVATVVALYVKSIYVLWFLSADLVYVLLFPQLLLVLYNRGISRYGVAAGFAVGFLLRLGGGEVNRGLPALLPYPAWLPFKSVAMLSGLLVTLVVSRLPLPRGESHPVPWLPE